MSYKIKLVEGESWELEAPDGTVLSEDNQLPVKTPDDIADDIMAHAGNLLPIYKSNYEVIDQRN